MPYRLQWTERKKEEDYEAGFGIGPRFHSRFRNTKVVKETDRIITFERIVLDSETVADHVHHLRSWDGNFDIKVEKVKKDEKVGNKESKILKAGCPICLIMSMTKNQLKLLLILLGIIAALFSN